MTEKEKADKVDALGNMAILKPDIDDLKEKRRKIIARLHEALSNIGSDRGGYIIDYTTTHIDDLVQSLHTTQHALMVKVDESNRHAERAGTGRILTRTITV